MSNVAKFPNSHQIESEACAWIAQIDGDTPSPEDLAALREWVNRSPQHRAEITRLAALWNDLNLLTELATPGKETPERPLARRFVFKAAAVAVLVLLVTAVTVFEFRPSRLGGSGNRLYSTQVGERQSVSLEDGTRILLNTESRVRVTYGAQWREVHLLQGEAYFQVAQNPARPFVVYAGTDLVRALGTAFTVHLNKQDVEVLVTEGAVEIAAVGVSAHATSSGKAPDKPLIRLAAIKAGQSAAVNQNQQIESIQSINPSDMDRKLSWRNGILTFSGEPLDQVVEEISRYTSLSIVITDPAIRKVRIGGYFKIGETDAMLEALETSFGVRVTRVNDRLVYLTAK